MDMFDKEIWDICRFCDKELIEKLDDNNLMGFNEAFLQHIKIEIMNYRIKYNNKPTVIILGRYFKRNDIKAMYEIPIFNTDKEIIVEVF